MVHPLKQYQKNSGIRDQFGAYIVYEYRDGFRQPAPYTVNTDLDRGVYWMSEGSDPGYSATSWGYNAVEGPSWGRSALRDATNGARSSFVNRLGDSSSFGATLTAERKETWATVVGLVTKALTAARQVKALRLADAARTLGLPYKEYKKRVKVGTTTRGRRKRNHYAKRTVFELPTGRTVVKTAANGWLLYSYGVKPLAEDIYNGMDVLQRPLPSRKFRGSGSGNATNSYTVPGDSSVSESYSVRVSYSAEVSVENPNLWLANKMGLINPAQWALEAIPFSFVVDWFSNLSDVVNSMTDLAGLNVSKGVLVQVFESTETKTKIHPSAGQYQRNRRIVLRKVNVAVPSASLSFGYERFSWQRGLNAISLLVGFLPRK